MLKENCAKENFFFCYQAQLARLARREELVRLGSPVLTATLVQRVPQGPLVLLVQQAPQVQSASLEMTVQQEILAILVKLVLPVLRVTPDLLDHLVQQVPLALSETPDQLDQEVQLEILAPLETLVQREALALPVPLVPLEELAALVPKVQQEELDLQVHLDPLVVPELLDQLDR